MLREAAPPALKLTICAYTLFPMVSDRELSQCSECLCLASRRAARAITRAFDRQLRPHGIRTTQFSVLAMLALKGPQSIGDLADLLGTDRTTLTRNLALLEGQSLVRIRQGDDARARIVALEPKGRSALTAAFPAWRKAQSTLSSAIGSAMADNLRRLARSPQI
jgi:DNA-binding MarR family transcriptional regulator